MVSQTVIVSKLGDIRLDSCTVLSSYITITTPPFTLLCFTGGFADIVFSTDSRFAATLR